MRASNTKDGLTLRAIAGSNNVLLGIDLDPAKRAGCLGFSIWRTDLGPAAGGAPPGGPAQPKPFPSLLRFLSNKDKEDDSWSAPYYVEGGNEELGRKLFAGTA